MFSNFLQVGDKFKIVLEKGSLGVQGGQNHFIREAFV